MTGTHNVSCNPAVQMPSLQIMQNYHLQAVQEKRRLYLTFETTDSFPALLQMLQLHKVFSVLHQSAHSPDFHIYLRISAILSFPVFLYDPEMKINTTDPVLLFLF